MFERRNAFLIRPSPTLHRAGQLALWIAHAQVAREIRVVALLDADVVGEQLERDDVEDRLQAVDGARDVDEAGRLVERVIRVGRDDDRRALAGGDLLECRLDLRVEGILPASAQS